MAILSLKKGPGKQLKVKEKSVKNQGILKRILSGNPENLKVFMPKMQFQSTCNFNVIYNLCLCIIEFSKLVAK